MSLTESLPAAGVAGPQFTAAPGRMPSGRSLWRRWGGSIPELCAVAVAGFGLPAMVLLLLGQFRLPWVLGIGLVTAAVAVRVLGPEAGSPPASRWLLATVALAGLAFVANARMANQDLYAVRDPGTYVLAGQWLAGHHSLPIDTQPGLFGPAADGGPIHGTSAGFAASLTDPGHVDAQGNHLLPALLAVAGWLGGTAVLLKANALVGAVALLGAFGLVRRVTGEPLAFAATAALAVSMPMIAFSRDAYTEPLALLLLLGGLSVLWRALASGRAVEFLLAGLTAGTVALDRIDGYASLVAIVGVAAGYAARAAVGQRDAAAARSGLLLAGMAGPAVLGFIDVTTLAGDYYRNERQRILPLLEFGVLACVLGAVLVVLAWRSERVRRLAGARPRAALARVAVLGILGSFAVLVSRPFWQTVYEPGAAEGACNTFIPQVQASLGTPIQPCRSYGEYAVHWLAWYVGWPTVVLGVAGIALLAHRAVRHGDLRLLGPVLMLLGMAGLYLYRPAITPDQVWAMRRYLPVVLPGLLGGAAYAISQIWVRPRRGARPVAVGLAGLLVLVPAAITHPMETVRQYVPQLAQVREICDRTGGELGAVLVVGSAMSEAYLQTVRATCGIPVQGVDHISAEELAAVRRTVGSHGRRLFVITQDVAEVSWSPAGSLGLAASAGGGQGVPIPSVLGSRPGQGLPPGQPAPTYTAHEQRWPTRLTDVPQHPEGAEIPVWIGAVLTDGSVLPLPPAG
ncbi:MAG: hypothetical protein HY241_15650 [Actinobacteria bacterium]|nr:hypothetical protein [Actinomycetota bacterium]